MAIVMGRLRLLNLSLMFLAGSFVGVFPAFTVSAYIEDLGHLLFNQRSAALISAIENYTQANARPPATLGALVPLFLAHVPGTGMPIAPTYTYGSNAGLCTSRNAWNLTVDLDASETTDTLLIYCPERDYRLAPVDRVLTYTEFTLKGNWVYSYTDLDD